MTKPASPRRAELLLTTALVALIAVPAAGQVVHTNPVLENTAGAAGGASIVSLSPQTVLIGLPESQPRTIIRWDSFDIGANSSVSINGIYGGSARPNLAVLNRVTGTDSSDILGSLTSEPNISVFLINSNGILFGSGARVNVGSLFASTLNIVDADFLQTDGTPGAFQFRGTAADAAATVSTGIALQSGAVVQSTAGPLLLIGGFVNLGGGASVSGAQDVGLIAANSVTVTVPAAPGSPLSYTTGGGSPVVNGIAVGGQVVGRNVDVILATKSTVQNALLLIDDTGSITATPAGGGDINISAASYLPDNSLTYFQGRVENDGTLEAPGDIFISGRVSGTTGAIFRPQEITNNGTIDAGGDTIFRAHGNFTNTGLITAGSGVELLAETGIITNSNTITATGDVDATSGGTMFLGGMTQGRDVALNSGGSIHANYIQARDDIAIRAVGAVTSNTVTSGATINGDAPIDAFGAADSLLDLTMSGHDIDINGQSVTASSLTALGIGSDIHLWTDVSAPAFVDSETAYFLDDLDFRADGNITIDGSAEGPEVSMIAGGNLSVQNVSALDDIVLKAGGTLSPGIVQSGVNIAEQFAPVDQFGAADAEEGVTLAGHEIILSSPGMRLTTVTAAGTGSDITTSGGASALNNQTIDFTAGGSIDNRATITSGGFVIFTAGGNITNRGAITAGSAMAQDSDVDVFFNAGGDINNSGAITTHDGVRFDAVNIVNSAAISDSLQISPDGLLDIQFNALGDITNSGALTSGEFIELDGVNITNSGAITAGVDLTPAGEYSILIDGTGDVTNSAALTGGDVIELDGANITNSAAITSSGDVSFFARNNILDSSPTRTGSISGRDVALSAGGAVTAGTVSARDDIAIRAGGAVTTDSLNSGATVNGNGPVDVSGAADSLLDTTLAGHDIDVAGSSIAAGRIAAVAVGSDIRLRGPVSASRSDLDFSAGGDIAINGAASGVDIAMNAGGALTVGNINARDDIALRSGGALNVGQLSAGVAPAVDATGAADAMLGQTLAGHDISIAAPNLTIAAASAVGTGSDLFFTAITGDMLLTSLSAAGNVTLDAPGTVRIGSLAANAGNINILADDLDIQTSLSGAQVNIVNRAGGSAGTRLGDFPGASPSAATIADFTLTTAELNRITTPVLTVDSLGQNLLIGNLPLGNAAGSTRVNLLGTGRVDLIGLLSAAGTGRTLQLGGSTGNANAGSAATLASIIRIAPTSGAGGRIAFDGGTLDLRGAKIGAGLDDGFLTPLGLLAGGTPLSTSVVARDWVANRSSTLYGVPGGYSNPTIISAGTLRVTYADYALFQNTAAPTANAPTGVNVGRLEIVSSGTSAQNSFALFGTISDTGGVGAALIVKPDDVSFVNSRVNGCLIVTGGGCGGGTSDLPIPFNAIDSAEASSSDAAAQRIGSSALATQKLVSTDEERTFDFESLVGTNNEGLLGTLGTEKPSATDRCTRDREGEPCRVGEKPNDQ